MYLNRSDGVDASIGLYNEIGFPGTFLRRRTYSARMSMFAVSTFELYATLIISEAEIVLIFSLGMSLPDAYCLVSKIVKKGK